MAALAIARYGPQRDKRVGWTGAIQGFAPTATFLYDCAGFLQSWLRDLAAEQERYHALAAVRDVFAREYVTPNGRLTSDASNGYALTSQFGLLPTAEQRRSASQRLAELVRHNGYLISTGFVGTPLVCDALCGVGPLADAYRLLLQREVPPGSTRLRWGHHDPGAPGQHAAGRIDKSGQNDLAQPLCAGRGCGLTPSHGCRSGTGRAGLPEALAASTARRTRRWVAPFASTRA